MSFEQVMLITVFTALITATLSYKRTLSTSKEWWSNYLQGISTEMIGAFITAVLFTVLVGSTEKLSDESEIRQRLISQMSSQVNAYAVRAAEELQERGWLSNGSLDKVDLSRANLQGADLSGAFLQGVNLTNANLENALLSLADLRGADLTGANLTGALLQDSLFNENTKLPDWTSYSESEISGYWTPDTDMRRFTDPAHPSFWHP
jgi:hypothetical protein